MKIELSSQRRKKVFVLVIQHGRFDVRCKRLSCKSNINNINSNCPNKIFSYGLKQTMLETEHILLKTV